jgi:hypothetical protein
MSSPSGPGSRNPDRGESPSSSTWTQGMEVGNRRFELILEPVSGKAVPVNKGEIRRVSQLAGG